MDTHGLIEMFGKIAGIGGLALGICMVVFRDIIAKNIFASLSKQQSYKLLRLIALLTFALGICGIVAWAYPNYVSVVVPVPLWPTNFEDVRSAEIVTSDVDDELQIAVNDNAFKSVEFGETVAPINVTPILHRGANKLTFTVLNGPYGVSLRQICMN